MWKNLLRGACAAILALLVGMLAHYFADGAGHDVPDRPAAPLPVDPTAPTTWRPPATPDQLNEDPASAPSSDVQVTPAPVKAADTSRVEPTHDVSPDYQPPAQPEPVGDYRRDQIMEPYPEDDLESQRLRAYARCVAGQEHDAEQVAYCVANYGPDSGYQG